MASPIAPPLEKAIRELKSANHTDGLYWMLVARSAPLFQNNSPIKRGTKFSDLKVSNQESAAIGARHTAGLWFSEEIVPLRSSEVGGMPGDLYVIWVWSTDWRAQSSTNAGITYSGESVSHPIYAREYLVRRDAWEASQTIATGSALTALIGVTITAAGAGYTTASGTVGNATVEFVVSGGALIAGIVTSEGSGITSGAALTITGDGAGATATAVIQPATAVLVRQEKRELPQDSNLSKEFVLAVRYYETLPGPALVGASNSETIRGRTVITTERRVDYGTDAISGPTVVSSAVTPESSVVSVKRDVTIASLPADEVTYDYVPVDIPRRIFSLPYTVFCNGTDQAKVVFSPVTKPGGSFMRKVRRTVSFSETPPGDTALNIFVRADLDYSGKIIDHHFHGVLNDAIELTEAATIGGCDFIESYTFPASSPSASAFAGQWWLLSRQTTDFGTTAFRTVTIEFFEPA